MGKKGLIIANIILAALILFVSCSSNPNKNVNETTIKNNIFLEGENVGGLKVSDAREKIREYASKIDVEPKDAKVDPGKWVVLEAEKPGKKVNIEKTHDALLQANEGDQLKLMVENIIPSVSSQGYKNNIVEIGSFSTRILDKQEERVNNIKLASGKLNYKKLAPGEEFSFNGTVGKRTEAKGYEEAPIIIKTEDGYDTGFGIGGGICQLSTTLYNALEKCNIEVTERHMHTKNVGYVPKGQDATVSYGAADFKFKNNRSHPIMIRTYLSKNYLTVKIFENRNG